MVSGANRRVDTRCAFRLKCRAETGSASFLMLYMKELLWRYSSMVNTTRGIEVLFPLGEQRHGIQSSASDL